MNFNGRDLLGPCLESVRRQSYPHRELIVVDNGSTDGSIDWLRQAHPEARIVELIKNQGFAGGCNAGIRAAAGDLIVTLNNDVCLDPSWLDEMVGVARQRPDVGMVAAKVVFAHAPTVLDSAGVCLDRIGVAWHRHGGRPHDTSEVEHEVFAPCAGAALYRREVFEDVGDFDEDFFCYLEDVDLAWRAQSAGWRCVYTPRARACHQHSATAVEASPFKRFHLGRNKVWLIAKNYPAPQIWLYLPAILVYDFLGILATLLRFQSAGGSLEARLASAAGRIDGLARIGTALAKRRDSRRRVPGWRTLSQMSAVPWPWVMWRRFAHLGGGAKSGEFDKSAAIT